MLEILLAPLQILNIYDHDDAPLPGSVVGKDTEGNKVDLRQRIEWYSTAGTLGYLTLGSIISVGIMLLGGYLAVTGAGGSIEISGAGIEVATDNLGFGFATLGAILYLLVGKVAVDKGKPNDKS